MNRKLRVVAVAALLSMGAAPFLAAKPAAAEPVGVTAGLLSCNVGSGWGLVLGSSRPMTCVYSSGAGDQRYVGSVKKFGVDIGYVSSGTIVWAVVAPTMGVPAGALAGDYLGATGSATIGAGIGANVLFGGFSRSISLQPVSVEGSTGLDVAGGIGSVTLAFAP
jgi:hypothetical protein